MTQLFFLVVVRALGDRRTPELISGKMKTPGPISTFTPNLHLEGAVVSTSSFAMFAVRNTSVFGMKQPDM